jgi:hypothetical protein
MYDEIDGDFVHGPDVYLDEGYMDEKWGYTAYSGYMVSNKGRVWSEKSQQFLKVKPMDNYGHLGVCLYEGGRCFYEYIHRLVAKAFIPNPNKHPIVRHIEDDPSQNSVEELLWGTQKDNMHDAIRNGRNYELTNEDRAIGMAKCSRPVIAIHSETGKETSFRSQGEASEKLKIPQPNISKVILGQRPRAGGYMFKEVEDEYLY